MTGPRGSAATVAFSESILKSAREEIRVTLRFRRGRWAADVRVYAIEAAGDAVETPKGLSVRPDLLRRTIEALMRLEREARVRGIIR